MRKKLKSKLMLCLLTLSVIGCGHSSTKTSDLRFDLIEPDDSDYECISQSLNDQLLIHNCKLQPDNVNCDEL